MMIPPEAAPMREDVTVTPGDVILFADEAFRNMGVDLDLDDVEDICVAMQSTFDRLLTRIAHTARPDAGDEVERVATPTWITRKVRKGTDEHRAYLRARFPINGGAPSPFSFDGHNWRYYVTSFDDIGEYDVIQRPPEDPAAMREGVDRGMVERVIGQAQFLCDRLDNLDFSMDMEDFAREHAGHVDPAHSRLKDSLAALSRKGG